MGGLQQPYHHQCTPLFTENALFSGVSGEVWFEQCTGVGKQIGLRMIAVWIQVLVWMPAITEAPWSHNNCRGNTIPLQTELTDMSYQTQNCNSKMDSIQKTCEEFYFIFHLRKKPQNVQVFLSVLILFVWKAWKLLKKFSLDRCLSWGQQI